MKCHERCQAADYLRICVCPSSFRGIRAQQGVNNTNDFILQGRKLKTLPMYATIFSTWMSIFAFIGAIAYFYEQGPIYMTTVGWDALVCRTFYPAGTQDLALRQSA